MQKTKGISIINVTISYNDTINRITKLVGFFILVIINSSISIFRIIISHNFDWSKCFDFIYKRRIFVWTIYYIYIYILFLNSFHFSLLLPFFSRNQILPNSAKRIRTRTRNSENLQAYHRKRITTLVVFLTSETHRSASCIFKRHLDTPKSRPPIRFSFEANLRADNRRKPRKPPFHFRPFFLSFFPSLFFFSYDEMANWR